MENLEAPVADVKTAFAHVSSQDCWQPSQSVVSSCKQSREERSLPPALFRGLKYSLGNCGHAREERNKTFRKRRVCDRHIA